MIVKNASLPFFFSGESVLCSLSMVSGSLEDLSQNAETLSSWLSEQELERYYSFPSEKRKLSYSLGRIAAKHAMTCIDSSCIPNKITITNSARGNPIVEHSDHCVSISHSKNYAICLTFKDPMFSFGIDIEHIDKNMLSALAYIAGNDEPIASNEKDLTIAWNMKESLSKAMLCGFSMPFESFFIERIELFDEIYLARFLHHPEYKSIAMAHVMPEFEENKYSIAITYDARLTVDYLQIQEIIKNIII